MENSGISHIKWQHTPEEENSVFALDPPQNLFFLFCSFLLVVWFCSLFEAVTNQKKVGFSQPHFFYSFVFVYFFVLFVCFSYQNRKVGFLHSFHPQTNMLWNSFWGLCCTTTRNSSFQYLKRGRNKINRYWMNLPPLRKGWLVVKNYLLILTFLSSIPT